MKDMFDSSKADFTNIDGTKDLYVSHVLQKAFIEANQKRSEAAAATLLITKAGSSMPSPPTSPIEFKADHPFLFFLRDKLTGMLLLHGQVKSLNSFLSIDFNVI